MKEVENKPAESLELRRLKAELGELTQEINAKRKELTGLRCRRLELEFQIIDLEVDERLAREVDEHLESGRELIESNRKLIEAGEAVKVGDKVALTTKGTQAAVERATKRHGKTTYQPTEASGVDISKPAPRRLLIMACSAVKRHEKGKLPALERYDGPSYRTLRAWMEREGQAAPVVRIVSGKFGLIDGEEPILDYDQRMNGFDAMKLQGSIRRDLKKTVEEHGPFEEVFIFAGQDYLEAIGPLEGLGFEGARVHVARGGIGSKLGDLKAWLEKRLVVAEEVVNG